VGGDKNKFSRRGHRVRGSKRGVAVSGIYDMYEGNLYSLVGMCRKVHSIYG
jgi:hypothetical protein